jgi:predicted nucleic acid-binding protein
VTPPPLAAFLARHRLVGLDTSPFIYHLQSQARYGAAAGALFASIERGRPAGVTSTITMLELLVQPLREQNIELASSVYALGIRYPHLQWVPASMAIVERAARLRAVHNLRTPDALQVATAIESSATGFVTNDRTFERIPDIEVMILERVVGSGESEASNDE